MLERNPTWLMKILAENKIIKRALDYNAYADLQPFTGVFASSRNYQQVLEYAHENAVFDNDSDSFSLLTNCKPGVVAPVGDCKINRRLQNLPDEPSYDRDFVVQCIRFIRNFAGYSLQHKVRIPLESSNGWPGFEYGKEKYLKYLEVFDSFLKGDFILKERKNPIVVVGTRAHPPTFNLSSKEWKIRYGDSPDGRFSYSPVLKIKYFSKRFNMHIFKAQRRNRVVNGHNGSLYAIEKVAVTYIKNILKLPIFVSLEEERLNKLLQFSRATECFKTDIKQFDSTIPKKVVEDILEGLFGDTNLDLNTYIKAFESTQVFKKNMQEKDMYWVTKEGLWQGNSSGVEGTTIINCLAAFIFGAVIPIHYALNNNKTYKKNDIYRIIVYLILQIPINGLALNILGDDFLALHVPQEEVIINDFYKLLKKEIKLNNNVFSMEIEDPKKAGLFIRNENGTLVARPSSSSFLINRLIPEKNANSIFRIGHAYPGLLVIPQIFKNSLGFEKNYFILKQCIKMCTGVSFDTYISIHKSKFLEYTNNQEIDENDVQFLRYINDPQRILWDDAMEELYDRYNITSSSMIPESVVYDVVKRLFADTMKKYTHHRSDTLLSVLADVGIHDFKVSSNATIDDRKPWTMLQIFQQSLAKGY